MTRCIDWRGRRVVGVCAALAMAFGMAASANAGVLDLHASAFDNDLGPGPGGAWTGTGAYSNGNLTGTVDYAVFTTAAFNAAFPGNGVTTLPGELVYAYQVLNTGTDEVSEQVVSTVNNSVHDIGSFLDAAGEIAPSAEAFGATTANWDFDSPNIMQNEDSYVLVFSSPNIPLLGAGITIDGGAAATEELPNPSNIRLPEPGTIGMLALAGGMLLRRRRG